MPKLDESLTDKVLRNLPVPAAGNVLWYDPDLKGFAGRVTSKGARAYVGVYSVEGIERRDTIGALGPWKEKAARKMFERWRRDADLGIDPRGEPEPGERLLFKRLAEQFLEHGRTKRGRELRPATKREYRRALITYMVPLHRKDVSEVHRSDAADLIRHTATKRGATTAMRTRAAGSRFYSWLIANGKAEANPFTGTEGYDIPKRKRVLSDAELRAIWTATATPTDFHLIVRLVLWTGTRRSEPGSMADSELVDGLWTVPGDVTKNWRPLALPLPRQTLAALAAWPRTKGRDMLFGRVRMPLGQRRDKPDTGFQGWSDAKEDLDARIACLRAEQRLGRQLGEGEQPAGTRTTKEAPEASGDWLKHWILHDLRRTVETRMVGLGIAKEIVNRVLNHAQGPIDEAYDLYSYLPEKRAALQTWANELDRIVASPAPGNVVRFAARA